MPYILNEFGAFRQIIQVTPLTARLVSTENQTLISEWKPPNQKRINVVACNQTQLVCASAAELYYLEIKAGRLEQIA